MAIQLALNLKLNCFLTIKNNQVPSSCDIYWKLPLTKAFHNVLCFVWNTTRWMLLFFYRTFCSRLKYVVQYYVSSYFGIRLLQIIKRIIRSIMGVGKLAIWRNMFGKLKPEELKICVYHFVLQYFSKIVLIMLVWNCIINYLKIWRT